MSQSFAESVEAPLARLAGHAWKLLAAIGVAAVLIGIAAFVWPGRTTIVVAVLFGIYLVVSGIFNLTAGLSAPMSGLARILTVLGGVLSIILGLLCFRDRADSILLLGIWVGISWLIQGFGRLTVGLTPGLPGSGWAVLDGILLLIGGFILLAFPISSLVSLVWVGGLFLIVMGLVEIMHAFQVRRLANP